MDSDSSRQWLERANEARARALEIPDPESRRLLLHVAETYDKLAQRVEAQIPRGPPSNTQADTNHSGKK
jgi:hypothetical protein